MNLHASAKQQVGLHVPELKRLTPLTIGLGTFGDRNLNLASGMTCCMLKKE